MVYQNMKRCDHPDGCSKHAGFGLRGGPRTRCANHKDPGMVNLARRPLATLSPSSGLGASREPGHGPAPPSGGSNMPAAQQILSSSLSATRGTGKRPRQAALAPASLPIRQPAADTTGSGSTRRRPRGVKQAVLPQATQAGLAGPSAEAPPSPPQAITTVHRGGVARKARVPAAPFPTVIRADISSGAPPCGEESAPLAGAAAGTRSRAARGTGIRATGPAATAAAAKRIHSGRGVKAAQATHRPFGDGQNKRCACS